MSRITPFLWFDGRAEEAARFYCSVFPNSRIVEVVPYGDVGPHAKGQVMIVGFELDGRAFTALNGGPGAPFTTSLSFTVECETQAEVDHYWDILSEGGETQRCGWLKDRFGLSWQIVPRVLMESMRDPDHVRSGRVMAAMMTMTRLDIAALRAACDA